MAKRSEKTNRLMFGIPVNDKGKLSLLTKKNKASAIHKYNYFGTKYDEKVKKSSEAEHLDPRYNDETEFDYSSYYERLRSHRTGLDRFRSNKHKNQGFNTLGELEKREYLRLMSQDNNVSEVLTKICDEAIVTSQGSKPFYVDVDRSELERLNFKDTAIEEFSEQINESFDEICRMFEFFNTGNKKDIWSVLYSFLVDGKKAYEIVFDNPLNPRKMLAIEEIDPLTIDYTYDIYGNKVWLQESEVSVRGERQKFLYDSQIDYIDWSEAYASHGYSYLSNLVKPFNNLRIMNEATLVWTITNSTFRTVYTIPTSGNSKRKSAQIMSEEINRLEDDVFYNSQTGEFTVNGQPNLKFSKDIFMCEHNSGKPTIETLGGDGPDLSDTSRNEYFKREYYKSARVPLSHLDSASAETWNLDSRSMLREEMAYGRFIDRIRSILTQLLMKPLLQQMILKHPEYLLDDRAFGSIKIRFESLDVFSELRKMDVMNERANFINGLKEAFMMSTPDGDQISMLSTEFLMRKYFPELTEEDIKLNKKLLKKERKAMFDYQREVNDLQREYEEEPNDGNFGTELN